MTPKQTKLALDKAIARYTAAGNAIVERREDYLSAVAELHDAEAEMVEKRAAFVAASKVPE